MIPDLNRFALTGQIALITGGGTGIGFGIAQCFVQAGAKVVLVGRRERVLDCAAVQLGGSTSYEACDITCVERLPGLVERITERVGSVSILVNNAGIHLKKPALDTTAAEVASVLETHVVGAYELTRLVVPPMLERGSGSILFIASMASLIGVPMVAAYSAAKSAHLGLVRSLASEFSSYGVRVNAVAPGWIETDMVTNALANDAHRKKKILGRTPMQRFGDVSDIGWAAVYLCSPAAKFVTGMILPVDGGASSGF